MLIPGNKKLGEQLIRGGDAVLSEGQELDPRSANRWIETRHRSAAGMIPVMGTWRASATKGRVNNQAEGDPFISRCISTSLSNYSRPHPGRFFGLLSEPCRHLSLIGVWSTIGSAASSHWWSLASTGSVPSRSANRAGNSTLTGNASVSFQTSFPIDPDDCQNSTVEPAQDQPLATNSGDPALVFCPSSFPRSNHHAR